MARYPRPEDIKESKTLFFFSKEDEKHKQGNFKYGAPYAITATFGEFPSISIRIAQTDIMGNPISNTVTLVGTEYFLLYFVILNDKDLFALQLSGDTETAGITIDNNPLRAEPRQREKR